MIFSWRINLHLRLTTETNTLSADAIVLWVSWRFNIYTLSDIGSSADPTCCLPWLVRTLCSTTSKIYISWISTCWLSTCRCSCNKSFFFCFLFLNCFLVLLKRSLKITHNLIRSKNKNLRCSLNTLCEVLIWHSFTFYLWLNRVWFCLNFGDCL